MSEATGHATLTVEKPTIMDSLSRETNNHSLVTIEALLVYARWVSHRVANTDF